MDSKDQVNCAYSSIVAVILNLVLPLLVSKIATDEEV